MTQSSRRLLLTLLSLLIILIFFNVPFYQEWFERRITKPLNDISEQLDYMDEQQRREIRLGASYVVSQNVAAYLRKNKLDSNAVILLPPKEYIKRVKVDFPVPEPVVFYYYTGIKAVWANSSDAETANYAILYQNNNLQLLPLDKQRKHDVLAAFRQYKTNL